MGLSAHCDTASKGGAGFAGTKGFGVLRFGYPGGGHMGQHGSGCSILLPHLPRQMEAEGLSLP